MVYDLLTYNGCMGALKSDNLWLDIQKYEFLVVGKFLGPKQSDGEISCRVDSSVIAPYFEGYSPVSFAILSCHN